ncbi:MAG: sigma-70 family RNA polymerase sigma factor [Gemmatimonadaceae bacterium]
MTPVVKVLRSVHIPQRMAPSELPSITELLAKAQSGDPDAGEALARAVNGELRALAATYLSRERGDHTLQPTALVNEAYLRLLGQTSVSWKNRAHFFGIAAGIMRRILVDHARRTHAARRDRDNAITLDDSLGIEAHGVGDILGVHEALDRLTVFDPRQARIVELKFFAGLSLDEIAEVLEVSSATVSREWAMARAWLEQELSNN